MLLIRRFWIPCFFHLLAHCCLYIWTCHYTTVYSFILWTSCNVLTVLFAFLSFCVPKYVSILNAGHHFFISISQFNITLVGTTMRCGPQMPKCWKNNMKDYVTIPVMHDLLDITDSWISYSHLLKIYQTPNNFHFISALKLTIST